MGGKQVKSLGHRACFTFKQSRLAVPFELGLFIIKEEVDIVAAVVMIMGASIIAKLVEQQVLLL